MDAFLQRIGTSKLERIFPVDNRTEERTRKAGLNLWYIIHFDKDTDLEQVAKDLSQVADVAKVQFTRAIQRSYDPNVRATVLTKQAMTCIKNFLKIFFFRFQNQLSAHKGNRN